MPISLFHCLEAASIIMVVIIKIIIVVTLINSDLCPIVSWWVLEVLPNYAWKVLENSFSVMFTNCVGARRAAVRARRTPWRLLLKIITWHITFPGKPHKICDRAFNYVSRKKCKCLSRGIKNSSGDICGFFFLIVCCCFPLSNQNATLWRTSVDMVLLDPTALFQSWKGKNNLSENGGFWQHPEK